MGVGGWWLVRWGSKCSKLNKQREPLSFNLDEQKISNLKTNNICIIDFLEAKLLYNYRLCTSDFNQLKLHVNVM